MNEEPYVQLNGKRYSLADASPCESLLRWLKRQGLTGTKEGCGDGDCGACTVALIEKGPDSVNRYVAVNSCLLPIGFLPGRALITVEALATKDQLHPVQKAMVDTAGSQCGYCTPGFVMSLFAAYYNDDLNDGAIEGNLCRCTGYGSIRSAIAELTKLEKKDDSFIQLLDQSAADINAAEAVPQFYLPHSIEEALVIKQQHDQAEWIGGATDLGVLLSRGLNLDRTYIALDRIAELKIVEHSKNHIHIGAGVSLNDLQNALCGTVSVIDQMLHGFAAKQVRNRATLGGNLGTASPIGDLLPVLLALDATVHCRSLRGEREVSMDCFFLDYRKTALRKDELITAVSFDWQPHAITAAYKVAKRQSDDISVVAACFFVLRDTNGLIQEARLAYGGVAAIPKRAVQTEQYLQGRTFNEETLIQALELLQREFNPLNDHRASALYRQNLVSQLFKKFIVEQVR
jgi:xanthine dehydrogenase small subunit